MVTVKLLGGLGNQMFQYAIGRYLAIKNNDSLTLDLTELLNRDISIGHTHRDFELDIFNIEYTNKTSPGKSHTFKDRVILKYLTKNVNENGYIFDSKVLCYKGNICLNGYWQNERYFKPIENFIRNDFTVKSIPSSTVQSFINEISSVNSVSVHFRLGDYLLNPVAKNFHGVLEVDYYKKAVSKISEVVAYPHFFIFSDDVNWVKENIRFEQDHTFISGNSNFFDLQLMSLCKHNIIANSSFSWWGAWLNQNLNKIVIAPEKWFNNTTTEIVPDQWTKI